jgi:uncharacterized iron-regulated protein
MMKTTIVALSLLLPLSLLASELDLLPLGPQEFAYQVVSAEPGGFFDGADGSVVDLEHVIARFVDHDVVLLGEEHTAMDQKLLHARLLGEMAKTGRDLVLAMEFFQREDQEALDRWIAGVTDERELLAETGWYDRGGYRWEYYRPVMETAREHGIRVVGVNVPREIPRAVNRRGLEGLSDDQKDQVGEISTAGSPQHRYLISRYFGETVALLPPGWFENMYAAQCLWDVVMARSILSVVADDTTVVLVVGSGHVAYDLGIPRRLDEERRAAGLAALAVITMCPATAPAPALEGQPAGHPMGGSDDGSVASSPPARFSRSLADVVAVFPDHGGIEAFPTVGLKLKTDDETRPVVSMVWPDTLAEDMGFAAGDRILDVNGTVPSDLGDLRFILAGIEWGERLGIIIKRGDETMELAALLFPTTDTSEPSTAPGYKREALDPFDVVEAVVVSELPSPDESSRWVRVIVDDGRDRVEVGGGDELLKEVHELDGNGRVARSVYRAPLTDGAVELSYLRDDKGRVTEVTRLDRSGMVVQETPEVKSTIPGPVHSGF